MTPARKEAHLLPCIAKVLDTLVVDYSHKVPIHFVLKLHRGQVLILVVLRIFPGDRKKNGWRLRLRGAVKGAGRDWGDQHRMSPSLGARP